MSTEEKIKSFRRLVMPLLGLRREALEELFEAAGLVLPEDCYDADVIFLILKMVDPEFVLNSLSATPVGGKTLKQLYLRIRNQSYRVTI